MRGNLWTQRTACRLRVNFTHLAQYSIKVKFIITCLFTQVNSLMDCRRVTKVVTDTDAGAEEVDFEND
jgi:hypothetical protein